MRELLVRTISGAVLVAVLLTCVLVSPWAWAALALFVVTVGTFEMGRLQQIEHPMALVVGVLLAGVAYLIAAMVGLEMIASRWLLLEFLLLLLPFLLALFSTTSSFKQVAAFCYGSLVYLAMPCAMTVFMYQKALFGDMAGARLVILVFALLWTNDTFAYLTGRLLGRHKLFPRISPGKTIEGSLGGLVLTVAGVVAFSHYASWLPMKEAVGMGLIAVVCGTLGDLCESMMKRQAGVKDSGKLIPGHGGILDRFDSVMFTVPFVFVYLLLL